MNFTESKYMVGIGGQICYIRFSLFFNMHSVFSPNGRLATTVYCNCVKHE